MFVVYELIFGSNGMKRKRLSEFESLDEAADFLQKKKMEPAIKCEDGDEYMNAHEVSYTVVME